MMPLFMTFTPQKLDFPSRFRQYQAARRIPHRASIKFDVNLL
ncbi:hypothetical protein [Burkholderia sp. BCC1047]|nr:hypothetical protein [Burkholderia sp. BCC1047]